MKIALVSDIHGNLPALKSVLEHMNTVEHDIKVCLGDIVGYGPFPNECVEKVVSDFNYIIMGNHDLACVDPKEAEDFTPIAKSAILWTQKEVTEANKEILRELGYAYLVEEDILLVHGNPRAPFIYTSYDFNALEGFLNPIRPFNVSFVGHTHVPNIWLRNSDNKLSLVRTEFNWDYSKGCEFSLTLPADSKAIANVGSVGQPRDSDPRACYAVYDTETRLLTYYRIPYSVDRTIGRMQQLGFSTNTWMRLLDGR